ncbi:replication initiator protein RctB domain-containing protein [Vibrio owensii]|uniref:replication initiator protein RctB domain-containing protein n=1 Tax=Vibrio owensii TaxID=696485 RepID=UPI004068BF8B
MEDKIYATDIELMHEEDTFLSKRVSSGGSIIHIPNGLENNAQLQNLHVSTSNIEFIDFLLSSEVISKLDGQRTISTSELVEISGYKRNTLNSKIRKLEENKFLRSVSFKFCDNKSSKAKAFTLDLSHNGERAAKPSSKHDRRRMNTRLAEQGYPPSPKYGKGELQLVSVVSVFPPEQLLSNTVRKKGRSLTKEERLAKDPNISRMIYIGDSSDGVPAEAKTSGKMMDIEDLVVFFALLSVISKYHRENQDYYDRHGIEPENLTPFHVDQILHALSRTAGSGPAQARIRDSLQAIGDTYFNLWSLREFLVISEFDDDLLSVLDGYAITEYRIFHYLSPLVRNKPEVIDNEIVIDVSNSNLYIVKMHPHLFNSIIKDKSHFALPTDLMRCDPSLFRFYLNLRSRLSKTNNIKGRLRKTFGQLFLSKGNDLSLMDSIRRSFRSLGEFENTSCDFDYELQILKFEMWGYTGSFSFENDWFDITADKAKVIECSFNDKDSFISGSNAPIVFNPLSQNISKKITRKLDYKKTFRTFHMIYTVNSKKQKQTVVITPFSETFEIDEQIEILASSLGVLPIMLRADILDDLSKISPFVINGITIDFAMFKKLFIWTRLDLVYPHLFHEFLNYLTRRTSIHREIEEFFKNSEEPDPQLVEQLRSSLKRLMVSLKQKHPELND